MSCLFELLFLHILWLVQEIIDSRMSVFLLKIYLVNAKLGAGLVSDGTLVFASLATRALSKGDSILQLQVCCTVP